MRFPSSQTNFSPYIPLSAGGPGVTVIPHSTYGFEGQMMGRALDHPREVTISDLTHLPSTPGDPGAPVLVSVIKQTDTSALLQVTGAPRGGTVQYRYWSYYGLREPEDGRPWATSLAEVVPSEFRVPFQDLSGVVDVTEGRGIFSFQARSADADGVPSGNSNIGHQMIGMGSFHTIGPRRDELDFAIPLPTPPFRGTPLPPLDDPGASRPLRPAILEVRQVSGVRTVEVELAARYSDTVEYRWWPYSGDLPSVAFDHWTSATLSGKVFTISEIEPRIPGDGAYTLPSLVGGRRSAALYNFQVRLVDSDGVPGDPSVVKVLLVWSD